MASERPQVIGICRFSYPAIGGFQVEHAEVAEREAYLYAPARMEERFLTFEQFTLPCLRAQTDPEFTFLIVVGESLPAPYRDRLMDQVADLPQARVIARPPAPHRETMREIILEARRESTLPSLQFRLDDDDTVGVGFVVRLQEIYAQAARLFRRARHIAVDFTEGYIATPDPSGLLAQKTLQQLWTPALALSVHPKLRHTIMNYSHGKLWRTQPVLSWPDEPMFIRGYNAYNDSRQKDGIRQPDLALLDAEGEAEIKRLFNVDAAAIRTAFGQGI